MNVKKTYKKPFKKTYKKGKNTSRKYKRTYKSNYGTSIVKAPVQARESYVTFPFVRAIQRNINANSATTFAVLGNSLIPMPTTYDGVITTGDLWVSGVAEYASFYNNYKVLGCKIKVQLSSITTVQLMRCVMIPIMCGGSELGSGGNVIDRINELDGMTYEGVAQQPFAQSKTLGLTTGGNACVYFSSFRKTKNMLAIKDTRDAMFPLNLPNPNGGSGEITCVADQSWFYYIRVFNFAASIVPIDIEIRCKYYAQLQGRNNYVPLAAAP